MQELSRYHRQMLLGPIGGEGQARLARSRVTLIGCGALGTVMADQLVRAGVGFIRIADRDVVELTNLQRQVLFDENDAREEAPKAMAAARRLEAINSQVTIEPHLCDVHAGNIPALCVGADLILDGTDNAQTRYLINDLAIRDKIPWIYGGCVGMEGRLMPILPGGPCLRCIFPDLPKPENLPTCDTTGVLGPAASIIASMQTVTALQWLTGHAAAIPLKLRTWDFWSGDTRSIVLTDARNPDCPCCARRQFPFLQQPAESTTTLCGRNAMQVRPATGQIDLSAILPRLSTAGRVQQTPYFLRCDLAEPIGVRLTLFADGRAIFFGLTDAGRAKSLYARYIGG